MREAIMVDKREFIAFEFCLGFKDVCTCVYQDMDWRNFFF